jgi:glycosyltransferase involved in cell wall biosynthesis
MLPESSQVRVLQLGSALSDDMAQQASAEQESNPRYCWLGDLPRWKTLRILARCRLLVLTSRMEGGANVIGEALACSVPVLSSRIAGSIGILGAGYPGYFPYGDTATLSRLIQRAETDERFYQKLKDCGEKQRPLVAPEREVESWQQLLTEICSKCSG